MTHAVDVGAEHSTGSATLADLAPLAAAKHRDRIAIREKPDGRKWREIKYEELWSTVCEVALGLVDLGIRAGDKVAIVSNTRPEWTYANLGILSSGAVSVSVYQTNSSEECRYVLGHSESRAVFVEDAEQLAKIRQVQAELPALEWIIVMAPSGEPTGAISLAELRSRGRARDRAELDARIDAIGPDDPCIYIYTSGTTGPPKGCILSHGNYREMVSMVEQEATFTRDEVVYLFLPLAHAFALLVQFITFDVGGAIAYWTRDPQRIIPELQEVAPTHFPSVPRIFEKIYTLARANVDPRTLDSLVQVGIQVRRLQDRGEPVPAELEERFEAADRELFQLVRNLFGGRIRQCATGAAPIAREILEFFYACGVPVMEGYGLTETATAATANRLHSYRFGSVGRPLPGVEVKIADDGEILVRGSNIFVGYYRDEPATSQALEGGWFHTGDLGHLDEDGFLYITGRKKDIIITAGGKNITPANLENDLKTSRWVSQAVVIGDRRPYLVAVITLDDDELPAFAAEHGLEISEVAGSEEMRAEIQRAIDQANAKVGRVEQIKRFTILPHDLTHEEGELTPTLKVKRDVVASKYGSEIDALYVA